MAGSMNSNLDRAILLGTRTRFGALGAPGPSRKLRPGYLEVSGILHSLTITSTAGVLIKHRSRTVSTTFYSEVDLLVL